MVLGERPSRGKSDGKVRNALSHSRVISEVLVVLSAEETNHILESGFLL